eukprot:CAMPEP_0176080376 /NCGR_PEP_ID=MMETSP0120_2-20121206/40203_1 /TAXON_ID=160619 /ORGANISM="Kryptoperidinium foliaceum, Strain CCMP 1326" /LENGTH=142 /DNA_ID=CAMNT_0017414139 /DNA_START=408 /DNA_END=833 /DNA_ORIENTATION=-
MPAAIVADDFELAAVRLHTHVASALLGVHDPVKTRPTTIGLELGIGCVERVAATCALEEPLLGVHRVVDRGVRRLGPLLPKYADLAVPNSAFHSFSDFSTLNDLVELADGLLDNDIKAAEVATRSPSARTCRKCWAKAATSR